MAKKLQITLVRSPLGCQPRHRGTVKALGLRKVGQTVEHADTETTRGMINTVGYLLNVEEIK